MLHAFADKADSAAGGGGEGGGGEGGGGEGGGGEGGSGEAGGGEGGGGEGCGGEGSGRNGIARRGLRGWLARSQRRRRSLEDVALHRLSHPQGMLERRPQRHSGCRRKWWRWQQVDVWRDGFWQPLDGWPGRQGGQASRRLQLSLLILIRG